MLSIVDHSPPMELDSAELLDFYKNGFHLIKRENYRWSDKFFKSVKELQKFEHYFEVKPKNNGARTLKNEVLESPEALFIIDYLFQTELIQKCMKVVGGPLFLTNYIFIECRENTKSLPWHRDSYHYNNASRVGPIPYNYKLFLSLNDLDSDSSGTEILKGTHNIDFNNYVIDKILGFTSFGKTKFSGNYGDALLFNGHALHRRPKTKMGKSRAAIIFGLAPVQWHQKKYLENHRNVIQRYNENFLNMKRNE